MGPQRCEAAVDEAQTSSWESGFAITINVPVWSMGAIVVLKTRKDLKPRTAWNAEIIENTTSVVKLRLTDWSDASQDFGLEGDASYSPKDIIDLYHDCASSTAASQRCGPMCLGGAYLVNQRLMLCPPHYTTGN